MDNGTLKNKWVIGLSNPQSTRKYPYLQLPSARCRRFSGAETSQIEVLRCIYTSYI